MQYLQKLQVTFKQNLIFNIPHLTTGAGVLYIHVHAARNLIGHSSRAGYEPYCVVRHGKRTIFKTHSLSGSSDPIWEKGTEILVPSCRGMELIFDVIHDGHTLGSHDLIGTAQLRLDTVRY